MIDGVVPKPILRIHLTNTPTIRNNSNDKAKKQNVPGYPQDVYFIALLIEC